MTSGYTCIQLCKDSSVLGMEKIALTSTVSAIGSYIYFFFKPFMLSICIYKLLMCIQLYCE